MRGTDSAALASICTEARLAELAAANLPADVDAIKAETDNLPSGVQKNVALPDFSFLMTDSTNDEPETGFNGHSAKSQKTVAHSQTQQNTPATEISNGTYKIDLTQAENERGYNNIQKQQQQPQNQTTLVFVTST